MAASPPIIDGHNDTLLALYDPRPGRARTFFEQSDIGHIDLPRARAGGLGGGFFAVYVPEEHTDEEQESDPKYPGTEMDEATEGYSIPLPPPLDQRYALAYAMGMVDTLIQLEKESAGTTRIVHTVAELESCLAEGVLAMILHFEGADPIDPDLHALYVFHAAGLRSLGITWSRPNLFGCGVPFVFPGMPDIGPGLTAAGKRLVTACNALGIMLDLSHLNARGFWDVAEQSSAPLVATHSGVHALCPSPRNLTDDQLDAIATSGGIVGVTFHIGFLRPDGRANVETSVTEIVDHIDYMVNRMGIEHVAFGSDFDGATMAQDLRDAAGLPRLLAALRSRGYDEQEVAQIAYKNWVQVLRKTWKV